MGEDECGAGNVADLAGGDVLESAPALGEQGEPAFAETAQGALEGIAGAGANIEFPSAGGLLDRDMNADAGAAVAGVGQGGQVSRCQKLVSARLPSGVPRRRRSASSSFATNCASSLGTSFAEITSWLRLSQVGHYRRLTSPRSENHARSSIADSGRHHRLGTLCCRNGTNEPDTSRYGTRECLRDEWMILCARTYGCRQRATRIAAAQAPPLGSAGAPPRALRRPLSWPWPWPFGWGRCFGTTH